MALVGLRKPDNKLLPRTTLASIESLSMPPIQEVVFLADFRCAGCQKRVAEIMSRLNGEAESVVVSVLEKKVTLTCTRVDKVPGRQVVDILKKPLNKVSAIVQLFRSSKH